MKALPLLILLHSACSCSAYTRMGRVDRITLNATPVPATGDLTLMSLDGKRQAVQVPTSEGLVAWSGEKSWLSHRLASFLTLSMVGLLMNDLLLHRPTDRTLYVIIAIFYLAESAFCSTRRYISNVLDPEEVMAVVHKLQNEAPKVYWRLICYHHRRGSRKDSERIVTHSASRSFEIPQWDDTTASGQLEESLKLGSENFKKPFLKITLLQLLTLVGRAGDEYRRQMQMFLAQEGNRDRYTEISTHLALAGFRPKLLGTRSVIGGRGTRSLRILYFWIFTLLGMTVPYRVWFGYHCEKLEVAISKEVSG